MENYSSRSEYTDALLQRACLPDGFRTASVPLTFRSEEGINDECRMNLSLILADAPCDSFAGVFTRNAFPGAPVLLNRERMRGSLLRGILINNKIANVCTENGTQDAERLLAALAEETGCPSCELLSASTGVIGWKLPVTAMQTELPALVKTLRGGDCVELARGIMTTDAYPKVRSARIGNGTVVAVAKGAGMIEPNLATMLVFVMTDVEVARSDFQGMLGRAAEASFNAISVDSDQSTSDMVLALSSGRHRGVAPGQFEEALTGVCRDLAEDIVRNGEGTQHVVRVTVTGAPDRETASGTGKALVNSPLVKTAIFGNDPNVGRIVAALGDYLGNRGIVLQQDRVVVTMGDQTLFRQGAFLLDADKEERLYRYLSGCAQNPGEQGYPQHDRCVEIGVELNAGSESAEILGSDLSYEYVRENAEYRS